MAVINDPNVAGNIMAVKAASTAPIATDPAAVVSLSPNSSPISLTGNVTAVGNAASGAADSGNPVKVGGVYNSAPITLANGQRGDIQLDANGYLEVNIKAGAGSGGTAIADGAAFTRNTTSETPAGGVAETVAPTLVNGTAAALSLNTSGGLRVDGSGVTQPVSGTVTAAQATAASFNAQVVGNAASGAADSGNPVKVGGVYNSAPITLTNGQRGDVQLDANGYLNVNIKAGAGSGGTAIADGSTFTRGTTSETPAGGVAETAAPTLTDGKAAALSLNTSGGLRVDGSAVTQPVSAASLPLPTGASTSALQTTGNASLASIDGKITAVNTGAVVVSSSALPTGAATAAKQPAIGTAGTASADVLTIQGIAAMTALKVDGSGVTQPVSGTITTTPPANASTNVAQVGGTATDTNSGVKSAGTIRVVLATDQPALTNKLLVTPDANSAVNVSQINGVAVTMGNGVSGTGVQRVTLASDSTGQVTLAAGAATIGALTANQSVNAAQINGVTPLMGNGATGTGAIRVSIANDSTGVVQPGNTANTTPWLVTDTASTSGGLAQSGGIAAATVTKVVAKASAGQIYSITAFNLLATPVYIKIWNAATGSVTLGTTPCDFQFMVPGNTGGAGFVMNFDKGIAMSTAITFATSNLIGTTDNTAITANSVIVNFFTK